MPREFDCVVAGAGLVGAPLALGLARLGLKIALVEQRVARPAPSEPSAAGSDARGLALARSSARVLTDVGLWPVLAPHATPITTVKVSQRGHFGTLRLSHTDLGVEALGYVWRADHLQAALDAAVLSSTVTRYWGARVTGCDVTETAATVHLATTDSSRALSAALVVAADGVESAVRRVAGIAVTRHAYAETAIVANVDVERPAPNTAFERFTTSGPLALLPLGGRRYVAVRTADTATAQALLATTESIYLAELQQRFGDSLGAFSKLGPRQAHPLVLQRATKLHAPRVLLVGNAANTVHPNAAQGLNLGLRDCAVLLTSIADARMRGVDLGATELLQTYAKARAADHRATACFTDTIARVFALPSSVAGATRALGLIVVDRLPLLKRGLLQRLAGSGGAY
ncbi:MAG: FAD-dependent monooxygenase [Gammaproteobacteria bacterium]|nr:FAD-dependent monooxygenase [Gammaproteobacteria bacterium]